MKFKSLILICLCALCVSFTGSRKLLIGTWNIDKVILKNGKTKLPVKWLELKKDGTLNAGNANNDQTKAGKWKYNEKAKTLELRAEPANKDDGVYQILKLTPEEMELTKDSVKVYLSKMN